MGANNMEALAGKSIEQITQEALDEANTGAAAGDAAKPAADADQQDAAAAATQDVLASSGQADGQASGDKGESDKDKNFAALRTKNKHLAEELEAAQAENARLAAAKATQIVLPEEYAQRIGEVDSELVALGEKFQDGDLTWEEHQAQLREITARRDTLVGEAAAAQTTQEISAKEAREAKEATEKQWFETADKFVAGKPDGVDYSDAVMNRDLNTYVKALAADPDNNDKPAEWFLQEAHTLVKAKHGVASAPGAAKPGADQGKPIPAAKPSLPIHSLSDLPGGVLPANTEVEQLGELSGPALTNRFLNDPKAIEKALAALG